MHLNDGGWVVSRDQQGAREHGLHPIVVSTRLHLAARRHSHDMLGGGYFAHTSPTGSTLTQRVMTSGFITYGQWWAGETLAGQRLVR